MTQEQINQIEKEAHEFAEVESLFHVTGFERIGRYEGYKAAALKYAAPDTKYCQCKFVKIMRGEDDKPYCARCKKLVDETGEFENTKYHPCPGAQRPEDRCINCDHNF